MKAGQSSSLSEADGWATAMKGADTALSAGMATRRLALTHGQQTARWELSIVEGNPKGTSQAVQPSAYKGKLKQPELNGGTLNGGGKSPGKLF